MQNPTIIPKDPTKNQENQVSQTPPLKIYGPITLGPQELPENTSEFAVKAHRITRISLFG